MRLLLDTHIWVWSLAAPELLGRGIRRHLETAANELWLSPISVWEVMLLAERGRIELDEPPDRWVDRQLTAHPMREAPLTRDVAIRSRTLPFTHQDPADRFLAATAAVYGLKLVTADPRLWKVEGCEVLPSR